MAKRGHQFGRVPTQPVLNGHLRQFGKHPAVLAAYIAYTATANAEGKTWISGARIAKEFGLSEEAVRKAKKKLIDAGLLHETRGTVGRCNVYQVVMDPQPGLGGNASTTPKRNSGNTPSGKSDTPNSGGLEAPTRLGVNRGKTYQKQKPEQDDSERDEQLDRVLKQRWDGECYE